MFPMFHLGQLLIGCALGCMLGACGTFQSDTAAAGVAPRADVFGPESGISTVADSVLHPEPRLIASASFPADGGQLVHITWRLWDPSAVEKLHLRGTRRQEIALPFQPTALEFMAPSNLIVGGVAEEDLVIELWTLKDPFATVLSSPSVGQTPTKVAASGPVTRREIFRERLAGGKGLLTQVIWNRATKNGVFCLFRDDRNLYELRWGAEPGVHSISVVADVRSYPELAGKRYNSAHGGDHYQAGYVYAFGVAGQLNRFPSLVLWDQNRDGQIDECSAMPLIELDAFGFSQARAWRELDGLRSPARESAQRKR